MLCTCRQVTSVEVCTLNIEVEFCLQIDLQVTWPVSKSDDTAPAPLPPADLTPPGISVTTYTVYFSNPYDASLAQATAGDQEAADVRISAFPTFKSGMHFLTLVTYVQCIVFLLAATGLAVTAAASCLDGRTARLAFAC